MLTGLKRNWRRGTFWRRQFLQQIIGPLQRISSNYQGTRVLGEDWDNLILLDGCRYDLFKEVNTIEGELTKVKSNASSSDEFFEKNIFKKFLS